MTLLELLQLLKKHLFLCIFLPILCAGATAAYAWLVMPNTYTATVSMYVLSSSSTTPVITSSDLSASQMITNDVATLIKSDKVEADTAKAIGAKNLDDYTIKVTSSTSTRVITVDVTGEDPQGAANVANQLAATSNTVAQAAMGVESINVIDQASVPQNPSGPRRLMYVGVAFLAGLFVAIALVVLMDMLNKKVRNVEDIERLVDVPCIGRIPKF